MTYKQIQMLEPKLIDALEDVGVFKSVLENAKFTLFFGDNFYQVRITTKFFEDVYKFNYIKKYENGEPQIEIHKAFID